MALIPLAAQGAGAAGAGQAQQAGFISPAEIERRRRLADLLRQNASRARGNTPIEAVGGLAQTLTGAFLDRKANRQDQKNQALRQSSLNQALTARDPAIQAQTLARSGDPQLQQFGVNRQFNLQDEQRRASADAAAKAEARKREDALLRQQRANRVADREDTQAFQAGQAELTREATLGRQEADRAAKQQAAEAKTEEVRKKQTAALRTLDSTTDNVTKQIDTALKLIRPTTTGIIGQATRGIGGSDTFTLDRVLDSIRANVAFGRLQQMRAESPTGGALGNVSNIELDLLASVEGSLAVGQRTGQLRDTLTDLKGKLENVRDERLKLAREEGLIEGDAGDESDLPEGVTEEDIAFTMERHGLSRDDVLRRIRAQ